jgi:hypothetical protein
MKTRTIIITAGVAAFLLYVAISATKDIPDLINFYNNNKIASGQFIIQAAEAKSMYEDQLTICNFEQACQVVNADNYLTKKSLDKLWVNFNQDLDTFSVSDLTQNKADYQEDILIQLDNECRDNYHSFCFGEAWNSLTEYLN